MNGCVLEEENGWTAREQIRRKQEEEWVGGDGPYQADQLKRGIKIDGGRLDFLACRAEPGANSRGMRAGLMMPVMLGMGHTGRSHGSVHQNETERQGPYGYGVFESNQHSVGLP